MQNMKSISVIIPAIFLILNTIDTYAQVSQPSGKIGVNVSPGGIVEQINTENAATIKGSIYFKDAWDVSNVYFKNGLKQLEIPIKYDLKNQVVKLKYPSKINIFSEDKIERFELIHQDAKSIQFVNCSEYEDHHNYGFFRVVLQDQTSILSLPKLNYIKPNYVATHDAGNKEGRYVVKEELYLAVDQRVTPLPLKKSEFFKFFGKHQQDMQKFIKNHKLKYKKEADLITILIEFNRLTQ